MIPPRGGMTVLDSKYVKAARRKDTFSALPLFRASLCFLTFSPSHLLTFRLFFIIHHSSFNFVIISSEGESRHGRRASQWHFFYFLELL
jgi:hypothetical protein